MEIQLKKSDYLWGYVAFIFRYGNTMLILPLLLRYLPTETFAIAALFAYITTFTALFDLGFTPCIARQFAFAYSGVKALQHEGVGDVTSSGEINYVLLRALIDTSRKIYAIIAGVTLLTLSVGGTFYLWEVLQHKQREELFWEILPIWGLFIASTVLGIFYKYLAALMEGRGGIGILNKQSVLIGFCVVVLSFVTLRNGWGLYGTTFSGFVGLVASRYLCHRFLFDKEIVRKLKEASEAASRLKLFPVIWHNAKKLGINSVGVFLINQMGGLLGGLYLTLAETASLLLTLQAFSVINIASNIYFNTSMPRFASLFARRSNEILKREFLRSMLLGTFIFLCGLAALLFLGPVVITWWKSKTILLGPLAIGLYGVAFFMEGIHGRCAAFITIRNIVPFVWAGLLTGLGNLALSIVFLKVTSLGVIAFPLALIIAHAVYNFWRWPVWVVRNFQIRLGDFSPKKLLGLTPGG
ncbi:MAG: hypothetical protein LBD01_03635 [Puniceicoccales bacterium]|jgi:O-antigen/teichoic acid export membrane protein|nr:hypothetical protein [Puniceicoccales bacterium]